MIMGSYHRSRPLLEFASARQATSEIRLTIVAITQFLTVVDSTYIAELPAITAPPTLTPRCATSTIAMTMTPPPTQTLPIVTTLHILALLLSRRMNAGYTVHPTVHISLAPEEVLGPVDEQHTPGRNDYDFMGNLRVSVSFPPFDEV
jgi:hypothetical protein